MLHNNFEITTAFLFYFGNKDPNEIEQIFMLTKATYLVNQKIIATIDLAIIAKNKQLEKYLTKPKSNKKCLNYGKKATMLGTAIYQIKKNLKIY